MSYSTIDKPTDFFNTKLYTGNGSTQSITGVGFQPDWVWYKSRSNTYNHGLFDSVRGVNKFLKSNSSDAEATLSGVTSFNSDGFTVGSDAGSNGSGATFAAWNWKANGAGSANTDGSINSTVSANTTAGFSVVTYTGAGSAGTIGHGLNAVPSMYIVKVRSGRTGDWLVYHNAVSADPQTDFLKLNETNAVADEATIWNDTAPTSSVFSVGTEATVSGSSNTFVAYCFAEKKGYSKFGSYTGNGNADGTFVYTGFKPALVIIKRTTAGHDWYMNTAKINGFNVQNDFLAPNEPAAEVVDNTAQPIDIVSNGFKCRGTGGGNNENGVLYIYMAFAESPLVGSNFVPTTAR